MYMLSISFTTNLGCCRVCDNHIIHHGCMHDISHINQNTDQTQHSSCPCMYILSISFTTNSGCCRICVNHIIHHGCIHARYLLHHSQQTPNTSILCVNDKIIVEARQHSKWRQQHPCCNNSDPLHLLSRSKQVTIFRLPTGYNHLSHYLLAKLRAGQSEFCPCQTGSMCTCMLAPASITTHTKHSILHVNI